MTYFWLLRHLSTQSANSNEEQRGEKKSHPHYEKTHKRKDRRIIKLIAVDKFIGVNVTASLHTLEKDRP